MNVEGGKGGEMYMLCISPCTLFYLVHLHTLLHFPIHNTLSHTHTLNHTHTLTHMHTLTHPHSPVCVLQILADDVTGNGELDLIVSTMSGNIYCLGTHVPFHPAMAWTSHMNGPNGFTARDGYVCVCVCVCVCC